MFIRTRSILRNGKSKSNFFRLNSTTTYKQSKSLKSLLISCTTLGLVGGWLGANYYMRSNPPSDLFPLSATTPMSDISQSPKYASLEQATLAINEIRKILKDDQISTSESELYNHSDNSSNFHKPNEDERPYIITYPESIEEVSNIVKICNEYSVPMIPFSGGTSIEGHFIPTRRGISIDVTRMNQVLALHEDDLDVVVQPGIGWQELGEYLDPYGLMFGPDPGPGACIGGMVATNCSGTRASRYGTMKDNVISIKAVLSDGTIIKTKNRPRKSSSGYNLTGLFVGSEGTLGIIVEATLKLNVKPENEVITIVNFNTIQEAAKTVTDIFRAGIAVNAVELMDARQMKCIKEMEEANGYSARKWSDKNLLLFKLGGSKAVLKDQISTVKEISRKNGGFNVEIASDENDKQVIWNARKTQLWTSIEWAKKIIPNARSWPTDVAVPVSKLPKVIAETAEDIEAHGLITTVVGHVGDGNIHALVIFPPEKLSVAERVVHNMVKRAIDNEGTVSGEHGVGIGKREFLEQELGVEAVDTMRKIKLSLDPKSLFNPDKIFKTDPNEDRIDNY